MNNVYYNKRLLIGLFLSFAMIFLLYDCKQYGGPNKPNKVGGVPQNVTNVKVKNIPGGAQLFYILPKNRYLKYVKAVFSTRVGGRRIVKASKYRDSLTVRGFANTASHKVTLYAVGEGGLLSKPDTVTIHPLLPPFKRVYSNIELNNFPGGVQLIYTGNNTKAKLAIVIVQDTMGKVLPVQTFYSSAKEDTSIIDGLQSERYELGYYVRDRYKNRSDTTYKSITPLSLYNKSKWKIYGFDSQQAASAYGLPPFPARNVIDGDESTMWASEFSPSLPSLPHFISIDMGASHLLHGLEIIGSREYDYQNPARITIQVSKDGANWSSGKTFNTGFEVGGKIKGYFYLNHPEKGRFFKIIILKDTQSPAPSNFTEVYAF